MNIENLLKSRHYGHFLTMDAARGTDTLQGLYPIFISISQYYKNTEHKEELKVFIHDRISKVLSVNLPAFDNGHNWGYPILCACFTLIKGNEELWELFTDHEHALIHQSMRMFALMWNFGCNAANDFHTGIGLHGNYSKYHVGVNYLLCNHALIVFLENYFGSIDALNELFLTVDYDAEMQKLKDLGMKAAYKVWTTPSFVDENGVTRPGARELFCSDEPIEAYYPARVGRTFFAKKAGNGVGCKVPFKYSSQRGKNLSKPLYIFHNILQMHCFNQTCVSQVKIDFEDDFTAHIADGTISPYEGQKGMIAEFNRANRSSIFHCEIDFMLLMCYFETMRLLGIHDLTECMYWDKVNVGMEDFIYKREHGYIGYAMFHVEQPGKWNLRSDLAIELWKEDYRKDIIAEA